MKYNILLLIAFTFLNINLKSQNIISGTPKLAISHSQKEDTINSVDIPKLLIQEPKNKNLKQDNYSQPNLKMSEAISEKTYIYDDNE